MKLSQIILSFCERVGGKKNKINNSHTWNQSLGGTPAIYICVLKARQVHRGTAPRGNSGLYYRGGWGTRTVTDGGSPRYDLKIKWQDFLSFHEEGRVVPRYTVERLCNVTQERCSAVSFLCLWDDDAIVSAIRFIGWGVGRLRWFWSWTRWSLLFWRLFSRELSKR